MVYLITDGCIDVMDKSCVEVCPVDCIQVVEGIDRMLFINPWECIGCGACEPACPVKAIYPEDAVPRDQAPFIRINGLWYEDADAARAFVNRRKPTD
jgi:ferredoxin